MSLNTNCKTMYIKIINKTLKSLALITIIWPCVSSLQLPIGVITDITTGVLQHYHSTCVFILQSTQVPGEYKILCVQYQPVPTFSFLLYTFFSD